MTAVAAGLGVPAIYSPPGPKEENLESKKNKKKLREIYRNSELDRRAAASKGPAERHKSRIEAINSYMPRGSQAERFGNAVSEERSLKRKRDDFSAESTGEYQRTDDSRY